VTRPPKLCYHVDLANAMNVDTPTLDPYSLRADCDECRKTANWLVEAHKEALRVLSGKQPALPDWCKEGATCRRKPAGRSCTIKKIDQEKGRVLVYDSGHSFWATFTTILTEWKV